MIFIFLINLGRLFFNNEKFPYRMDTNFIIIDPCICEATLFSVPFITSNNQPLLLQYWVLRSVWYVDLAHSLLHVGESWPDFLAVARVGVGATLVLAGPGVELCDGLEERAALGLREIDTGEPDHHRQRPADDGRQPGVQPRLEGGGGVEDDWNGKWMHANKRT